MNIMQPNQQQQNQNKKQQRDSLQRYVRNGNENERDELPPTPASVDFLLIPFDQRQKQLQEQQDGEKGEDFELEELQQQQLQDQLNSFGGGDNKYSSSFSSKAPVAGGNAAAAAVSKTTPPCSQCGTSLFQYRHRILILERELQWSKHCLDMLADTNERSKRDNMNILSDMLRENHALKLGIQIPEHVADIDKGRVVSLIEGNARNFSTDKKVLDLQEKLRLAVSARHREQSASNIQRRQLQQRVATLENQVTSDTKIYENEIERLRARLNKLRRGPRVQDLKELATNARSFRGSCNRLRAAISNLVEQGPLSAEAVNQTVSTMKDFAFGDHNQSSSHRLGGGSTEFMDVSTVLTLGGGASSLIGSTVALASSSVVAAPPDTNLKDLCSSLVNLWGGCDENYELLQRASKDLHQRIELILSPPPPPPPVVTSPKKKKNKKEAGEDDDDDDDDRQKEKEEEEEERQLSLSTSQADYEDSNRTDNEKFRSALYVTADTLTEGIIELLGELAKERKKSADLSRHLDSFKKQLRDAKAGHQPPHRDAETECYLHEFYEDEDEEEEGTNNFSSDENTTVGRSSSTLTGDHQSSSRRHSFMEGRSSRASSTNSGLRNNNNNNNNNKSSSNKLNSRSGSSSRIQRTHSSVSSAGLSSSSSGGGSGVISRTASSHLSSAALRSRDRQQQQHSSRRRSTSARATSEGEVTTMTRASSGSRRRASSSRGPSESNSMSASTVNYEDVLPQQQQQHPPTARPVVRRQSGSAGPSSDEQNKKNRSASISSNSTATPLTSRTFSASSSSSSSVTHKPKKPTTRRR